VAPEGVRVSIIIPVKPGGVVRALDALAGLDYPRHLLELILAEGKRPSCQRNRAAAEASGELLYFLDDDSMASPDMLRRAVPHFVDPQVAAVGGPSLTPASDTLRQKAFGAALSSLIGGGGVRNRYRKSGTARATGDNELILCNLCFRRDRYLECGGLDERLYPNEENELMDRLKRSGRILVHDPDLAVERSQRPTWRAFARQLFTYGRGRGEQTIISRRVGPASLVPSLFLVYLLLLTLADNPVYTLPLLCYAGAVLATAGRESSRLGVWQLFFLVSVAIPMLHLAYGAGMICGLLAPRFRHGFPPAEVKLFRVEI
jgi:glycosyltransferase involved in cell wall biosynthesis